MLYIRRFRETASQLPPGWTEEKRSSGSDFSAVDCKVDDIELQSSGVRKPSHEQSVNDVNRMESDDKAPGEGEAHEGDDEYLYDPNLEDEADQIEDDSPYPEVRCAVSNTDDPDMPAGTLRAWTMGILCAVIFPGVNEFMSLRWPTVSISNLVAILLAYPVGRLWARVVPDKKIFGIQLNPGPFTMKEHVIITIMASVGGRTPAYATALVAVQEKFYGQNYSFIYQWILVMSTQLIGFSLGGISRRILVEPPSMIWPMNLVTSALFNTLHSQEYVGMGRRGGWSREKFFLVSLTAGTAYYFFPGYIFTALSMFTWVCWIVPNNLAVKQMFGYTSGLGMSVITFDWAQIAYIGSPLAMPWWAAANVATGFVFFYWILTPILYFNNVWYSQYMPILSRNSFDNTGSTYNVTRILTPEATLDNDKYKAYSPLFLPTAFAVSYGLSFAAISATIVHTVLYLRKTVGMRLRRGMNEKPDIHARLMAAYPQVPEYYYPIIFVSMFALGLACNEVWSTEFPAWGLFLALVIAFVYTIPIGVIQAITNQQIAINVIAELIGGYTMPGRPVAMMLFKTYSYIGVTQALRFASDFKLGHYMKVPPRTMFWCQIVAAVVGGTVNLAVQQWMLSNIPDICSTTQVNRFICPDIEVFYTASIIWGVIGPANQFSHGQTYYSRPLALLFFFIIGAVLPVIVYFLLKRYPNRLLRYINVPLILGGTSLIPPATAVNYVPWTLVAFIFQYIIRRRHFSWWAKYNYVLSAALDSSIAIGSVLIFFCLEYPDDNLIGINTIQTWWGNTVYMRTADWNMAPLRTVAEGSTFGPKEW